MTKYDRIQKLKLINITLKVLIDYISEEDEITEKELENKTNELLNQIYQLTTGKQK